jgi:hypothetical protein
LNLPGHVAICGSPFSTAEAHAIVEGLVLFVGFNLAQIDAPSLAKKVDHIGNLSFDEFFKLARKVGFAARVADGQTLLVPCGYLMVQVTGDGGAAGLRWGMRITGDDDKVKLLLRDRIQSQTELAESTLTKFLQYWENVPP